MSRLLYDAAHEGQELGYRYVALQPGGKRPLHPAWQKTESTHKLLDEWFGHCPGMNIGIHCGFSRIAVLDCDTPEAADWVAENFPITEWWQESASGVGRHYPYFDPEGRVPIKVNLMNIGLDTRSRMSQIVASPSYSAERGRRWKRHGRLVRPEELPVCPTDWLADAERSKPVPPCTRPILVDHSIESLRSYISKIFAISGQSGHNETYRAACKLADAGLSEDQVFQELWAWNQSNAHPPFDEKAIRHKARDSVNRR